MNILVILKSNKSHKAVCTSIFEALFLIFINLAPTEISRLLTIFQMLRLYNYIIM